MHYNHFNPRALENIDISDNVARPGHEATISKTRNTHRILAESPKNAAICYTKRPSYNYKQYRITEDQVPVSTNYKYDMNKLVDMKQSTYY
jgi:hypothetical protein